jgi:hypothetical protein
LWHLQEVGCPVLRHEQLQLLIQGSTAPQPIHHFPLLQPLQGALPIPAEAGLGYQLGQYLTVFQVNLGSNLPEHGNLLRRLYLFPRVSSKWLLLLYMAFFQSSTSYFL